MSLYKAKVSRCQLVNASGGSTHILSHALIPYLYLRAALVSSTKLGKHIFIIAQDALHQSKL